MRFRCHRKENKKVEKNIRKNRESKLEIDRIRGISADKSSLAVSSHD